MSSYFINEGVLYIFLHFEQVYQNFFLENKDNQGIYSDTLSYSTIEKVEEILDNNKDEDIICINFKYLERIQINLGAFIKNLIIKSITKGKKIILNEINYEIIDDLISSDMQIEEIKNGLINIFINFESEETFKKYLNFEDLFMREFENKLNEIAIDIDQSESVELFTTPVYINKYFSIKKLIEDKSLYRKTIYYLSNQIIKKSLLSLSKINNRKKVFFIHNLNSAFIASSLATFFEMDIMSIDHIGPVNKIYRNDYWSEIKERDYIIVSDVICFGTETKIVENLIEYEGGNVAGTVALIKIQTVARREVSDECYVFKLCNTNNDILKYKISTDFNR